MEPYIRIIAESKEFFESETRIIELKSLLLKITDDLHLDPRYGYSPLIENIEKTEKQICVGIFSRAIHEGWGFVGCLDRAVLRSSYHHIRCVLELLGQLHFFLNGIKKEKGEKVDLTGIRKNNLRRYSEYYHVSRLQVHYTEMDLPKASRNPNGVLSSEDLDEIEKRFEINNWIELYGLSPNTTIKSVKAIRSIKWFYSKETSYISSLIRELDKRDNEENEKLYSGYYNYFCQVTHPSIVSDFSHAGSELIGLGDYKGDVAKVLEVVELMLIFIHDISYTFRIYIDGSRDED